MIFDFPIEKIEIKFKTTGSCVLKLTLNDQPIDLDDLIVIGKEKIQSDNLLVIKFSKDQGDDTESFAELEYFKGELYICTVTFPKMCRLKSETVLLKTLRLIKQD